MLARDVPWELEAEGLCQREEDGSIEPDFSGSHQLMHQTTLGMRI